MESVAPVTLSEAADNSGVIAAKWADVTLTRTLQGGIWNTLCLPFDVDGDILEKALGTEQNIQLRTFSGFADNTISFSSATSVPAGTPFLIKLNTTKANPIFEIVDMKTTAAQTVTYNGVSMVGVYSPADLPADGDNLSLFLTADGKLKKASSGSRNLKGMRAYFIVPASLGATARVMIDDEAVTTVEELNAPVVDDDVWYSIGGMRLDSKPVQKGVYVRNQQKVVIK